MNFTETYQGHQYSVTSSLDEQSWRFENDLCEMFREHNKISSDGNWELYGQNSCHYIDTPEANFYLIQFKSENGRPLGQLIIHLTRTRLIPFESGQIRRWGKNNLTSKDSKIVLEFLQKLTKGHTDLMSLRIQSFDFSPEWKSQLEEQSRLLNFSLAPEHLEYTSTRSIKMNVTDEELFAAFPSKTRAKIRHKSNDNFIAKEFYDEKYMPAFEEAVKHSFKRSADVNVNFKFNRIMEMAIKHPEKCIIIGYAKKDSPDSPLAFVVGLVGSELCEYYVGGSLNDPELRSVPFNYVLIWNLMLKSKSLGAKLFDYGGITDEGPDDPTANISQFKRRFPGEDSVVAAEYIWIANPLKWNVFLILKKIKRIFK